MAKEAAGQVLSIDGREVQITHPDKLYFSTQTKLTKLDLGINQIEVAGAQHLADALRNNTVTLFLSYLSF